MGHICPVCPVYQDANGNPGPNPATGKFEYLMVDCETLQPMPDPQPYSSPQMIECCMPPAAPKPQCFVAEADVRTAAASVMSSATPVAAPSPPAAAAPMAGPASTVRTLASHDVLLELATVADRYVRLQRLELKTPTYPTFHLNVGFEIGGFSPHPSGHICKVRSQDETSHPVHYVLFDGDRYRVNVLP